MQETTNTILVERRIRNHYAAEQVETPIVSKQAERQSIFRGMPLRSLILSLNKRFEFTTG